MAGSKYTIQMGVAGVQQTVAGINKVRDAQSARATERNADRQLEKMAQAERRAAEEALPAKQRLKNLDAERVKNAKRLEEAQRKLMERERRGVASPYLKSRIAVLKVANKEVDRQIAKVRQLRREESVGGKIRGAVGRFASGVGGQVAAGLGLYGIGSSARQRMSEAGTLQRQAGTSGVDVEFLQEIQFAGKQFSITGDQSALALRRMTRRLAEARNGTGELLPQLEKMGIATTDVNGKAKSTEQVLYEYADAIAAMGNEGDQTLAAFKAFDSEGAALVNVLRKGAHGLDEFRNKAQESSAVIEEYLVDRLAAADAQFITLGQQLKVWSAGVVAGVLPFFHNVKGGMLLMWDVWSTVFGSMKQLASEFIRNPFGITAERIGQIGEIALQRINIRANRRLREREIGHGQANAFAANLHPDAAIKKGGGVSASAPQNMADQLARIGGTRGGQSEIVRQMEILRRTQALTQQQLRELQRIANNTDLLT